MNDTCRWFKKDDLIELTRAFGSYNKGHVFKVLDAHRPSEYGYKVIALGADQNTLLLKGTEMVPSNQRDPEENTCHTISVKW